MKHLVIILSVILLPLGTAYAGEPSAMFGQELARVSDPNAINLDIYSDAPNNASLRVGLDSGEVILNFRDSFTTNGTGQSLNYKWFILESLALYGGLGINNTGPVGNKTQENHIIFGAAYTINTENIRFNINPVYKSGNSTSQTDVYAGAFMKFSGIKNKKMMLGAQLHADLTANTNVTTLGLRWLARDNVTIDLALFDDNLLQFPGLVAVNISF